MTGVLKLHTTLGQGFCYLPACHGERNKPQRGQKWKGKVNNSFWALQLCVPEVHLPSVYGHCCITIGHHPFSVSIIVSRKYVWYPIQMKWWACIWWEWQIAHTPKEVQLDTSRSSAWRGLIFLCEKLSGEPAHWSHSSNWPSVGETKACLPGVLLAFQQVRRQYKS